MNEEVTFRYTRIYPMQNCQIQMEIYTHASYSMVFMQQQNNFSNYNFLHNPTLLEKNKNSFCCARKIR